MTGGSERAAYKSEKFIAESRFVSKSAAIVKSGGAAVLVLHAAHFHAEVLGIACHNHSVGGHCLRQKSAYLRGETLLHL